METASAANRALKKLQNFMLDDHALKLSLAQKQASIGEQELQAKKDKLLKKRKGQGELDIADNEEA
jgi:hypothetical protein